MESSWSRGERHLVWLAPCFDPPLSKKAVERTTLKVADLSALQTLERDSTMFSLWILFLGIFFRFVLDVRTTAGQGIDTEALAGAQVFSSIESRTGVFPRERRSRILNDHTSTWVFLTENALGHGFVTPEICQVLGQNWGVCWDRS